MRVARARTFHCAARSIGFEVDPITFANGGSLGRRAARPGDVRIVGAHVSGSTARINQRRLIRVSFNRTHGGGKKTEREGGGRGGA